MTAIDFQFRGVTFVLSAGRVAVRGPKNAELHAKLKAEIARRDPTARVSDKRAGECMSCGDPMLPGRGGQCFLCVCAMQRIVDARVSQSRQESA